MPISGGIVTAPIDVYRDLGVGLLGQNIGDVWTIYNSNAIKIWSKKKPVPWSVGGTPNLYPQGAHPNDWWKGVNGDCGIISQSADTTNLLARMVGGLNGWTYERDSLAARVLDFDGYNHAASNPFDSLHIAISPTSVAQGGDVTVEYQLGSDIGGTYQLGLFDLAVKTPRAGGQASISDLYPAVVIYDSNNNYYAWYSASETIGALQSDPAMHHFTFTAPSTLGTYQFVPVLTNFKKESASQAISDIATIPGASVGQFTVARNVLPYMQVDAFVYNTGTSQSPNYNNTVYFYCDFMGGTNGGRFNNISIDFVANQGSAQVAYMTINNVQNQGVAGELVVAANSSVKKPAGSGNVYSKQWSSSYQSLENFVRSQNGMARIYCATPGSTLAEYSIIVREAAGMPGGQVIPF